MATTFLDHNTKQNLIETHHVTTSRDSVKTSVEKIFTHLAGKKIMRQGNKPKAKIGIKVYQG